MIHNSESISADNGIEIFADYAYEKSESQIEEGHGQHEVGLMVYTELKKIRVWIDGVSVDILPLMTEAQKDSIIEKLQYE